jgi:hypothetical protein
MDAFRHAVNAFLRVSVGAEGGTQGAVAVGPRGKGGARERPATADAATAARKVSACGLLPIAYYIWLVV